VIFLEYIRIMNKLLKKK